MKQRIEHVDVAKGISIMLVALFHSKIGVYFPSIIEPMSLFRMPLFFFLSGVFLSYSPGIYDFLWKKIDALLKPYFVTLILLWCVSVITSERGTLNQLVGIIYGNGATIRWTPLWFLTHLFIVYCFGYCIYKYTKFDKLSFPIKIISLGCVVAIGARGVGVFWDVELNVLGEMLQMPGLPFSLDIIPISCSFFLFGQVLRDKVRCLRPNKILFIASIVIFLCISTYTDSVVDLNMRVYKNTLFSTIGALSGIYFILIISIMIVNYEWVKVPLMKLGSGSLFVLIFHSFIGAKVYYLLVNVVQIDEFCLLFSIVAFVISVTLPLLLKIIISRNDLIAWLYLPIKFK